MADDGGSTGLIREEFGILPPGDIRRVLVALSSSDNKIVSELFNYRFKEGTSLKGHSVGNLLLTALERITGSFDKAVKEAVRILNVKGEVIPVTLENTRLCAELEDGTIIVGETNIDIPKHNGVLRIKKVFLRPSVSSNDDARKAIKRADVIVLGPGDLYTSILPNLLVEGIVSAIKLSFAKVIYVVNIMTKFGETNGFSASDFVGVIEQYLSKGVIDYCVVNIERPKGKVLERYKKERDEFVKFDKKFLKANGMRVVSGRFLRRGQFLRHDPRRLAKALSRVIEGNVLQ